MTKAAPSVRLAHCGPPESLLAGLGHAPTGRLAHKVNGQGDRNLERFNPNAPALLVSYVYLEPFLKNQHRYCYRDWVLDSGAFSAHNSGTEIKLQDYEPVECPECGYTPCICNEDTYARAT